MASGSKTRTASTHLECSCCKNIVTIQRKKSKQKDKGHIKHMYCYKCKEITAHIEMKEDIFLPTWIRNKNNSVEM